MSASLVGSEMCIRDRPNSEGTPSPATGRADCSQATGTLSSCGPSSLPAPVSYTHLTLPTICSV
eukprot:4878654-Alexandrium_andersonii.AAC.1